MKNSLFAVVILTVSLVSQTAAAKPLGVAGLFLNGELMAGQKATLQFEFPSCPSDPHLLNLQRKDSIAKVPSPETGKDIEVRYVNLVGSVGGKDKKCPQKKKLSTMKFEIESDPQKTTQYFVIVEAPAKILAFDIGSSSR